MGWNCSGEASILGELLKIPNMMNPSGLNNGLQLKSEVKNFFQNIKSTMMVTLKIKIIAKDGDGNF